MRDGAVRTYGTWTGVHTETGKEFSLSSYHAMSFKDGKIIGGGDFFDFGGFMASLQE
jgi:ketosteroid isomerase-like protein